MKFTNEFVKSNYQHIFSKLLNMGDWKNLKKVLKRKIQSLTMLIRNPQQIYPNFEFSTWKKVFLTGEQNEKKKMLFGIFHLIPLY